MKTSDTFFIPERSGYGAVELKEFIRMNTYKAFLITLFIISILFLLYWIYAKSTVIDPRMLLRPPISSIALTAPTQQSNQIQDVAPPPPAEAIIDIATAAKAGTPVPVPDTDIREQLKEFADVDNLTKSLSREKGQITDFDNVTDFDLSEKRLEVEKIEKDPDIDEFLIVEKEPQVDLKALQKSIVYPEMALKAGIEGKVVVRVLVGKDGVPKKAVVEYSDSKMLDKAAVKAVMKQVFIPAIQNGKAISCWVSIPINFKPRARK